MAVTGNKQFSILRALLDTPDGAGFPKELGLKLTRSEREGLVAAGLIESEKRGNSFWLKLTEKGRARAAGINISEPQALILWALLARENGAGFSDELPEKVGEADIDALTGAGLVTREDRGRPAPWLEVSDKGWSWAGENLDAPLPKRASTAVLKSWLARLDAFLRARGFALAEVLGPQAGPEPVPADEPPPSARARIRGAYLEITGGRFNAPVRLCDLREKLPDIERAELDASLRELHLDDDSKLSGIDNPREITPRVREAALDFKGMTMLELWISK